MGNTGDWKSFASENQMRGEKQKRDPRVLCYLVRFRVQPRLDCAIRARKRRTKRVGENPAVVPCVDR